MAQRPRCSLGISAHDRTDGKEREGGREGGRQANCGNSLIMQGKVDRIGRATLFSKTHDEEKKETARQTMGIGVGVDFFSGRPGRTVATPHRFEGLSHSSAALLTRRS